MKKQLTLIAGLIATSWAVQTSATQTQLQVFEPVNTTVFQLEISIEQPIIDISSSIREQANSNLQQQENAASLLLVQESRLLNVQGRTSGVESRAE